MPAVIVPQTHVFDFESSETEASHQIWIAEPVEGIMPRQPEPPATLYLLDANLFFGLAVDMTRLMHQLYAELPPILVVGIAYDDPSPALQGELRSRDFTPTADSGFGEMTKTLPGAPAPTLPEDRRLGRAPQFLSFLRNEVRPFVEERFDTAPDRAGLFGSSLGGLFTLYTFLTAPDAFDGYIATSPALWWDHRLLFALEETLAEKNRDVDSKLVLAVGANEERPEIPMLAPFKMVSNVREMDRKLRDRHYASLDLETFVLDGESHTSVVPAALTRGLRALYRSFR